MRVYLDHNATTPLRPAARAAMAQALDLTGNPSSVHAEGRAARAAVERARAQVAAAAGCAPGEVVFTSGATEAAGVLAGFGSVTVDPAAHDAVWAHRREGAGPAVHAQGLACGETGIVATAAPAQGRLLLLDATQAFGRLPFAFSWAGADLAILSSHKIGGPQGVGALIVRDGLAVGTLRPGGGQEMGRRSGTENVAGIAGFGAAAEAAQADLAAGLWHEVADLRDRMEAALAAASPQTIFVGKDVARLPNTSCLVTAGWKGETQVMAMDLAGFAVSAGSACSSGKVRVSRVLRAMGFDEVSAGSALRVSLSPANTGDEAMRFAEAWGARARARAERAA